MNNHPFAAHNNQKYLSARIRMITNLWMTFPVSFLFFCLLVLDTRLSGVAKILLSPWYWFVSIIAVWAGNSVKNLRWYGWYAFVFSNFTIVYENAWALAYFSESNFKTVTFLILSALQVLVIYVVGLEIRVPYFSPRIRWWENDPRYKFSLSVKLTHGDRAPLNAEIIDISRGGCFVKINSFMELDSQLTLDFVVFEREVRCFGQVVWRTESTVTHPKGMGVKFTKLDRDTTYVLKQATDKMRKLAQVYKEKTRERNWEEYLEREKQFQQRLKGLTDTDAPAEDAADHVDNNANKARASGDEES